MKKKLTLVLLVVLVLFVWGLIGVRIWKMTKTQEPPRQVETVRDKAPQVVTPDTLLLNYRDPFLDKQRVEAKRETVSEVRSVAAEMPMPQLAYKGLVRGKDKKIRAIVEVDGEVKTFAVGEQIQGARVVTIDPEFLRLNWRGTSLMFNAQ